MNKNAKYKIFPKGEGGAVAEWPKALLEREKK